MRQVEEVIMDCSIARAGPPQSKEGAPGARLLLTVCGWQVGAGETGNASERL